MTHNSAVAPYAHDGGSTGILFCHGFTGSPASMRPWAEFMARHGYSVRLPLLPGHGTSWREMRTTSWERWYAVERDAFAELRKRCDRVFIFGLSMGGTLTLRLAEQLGDEVAGIGVVNALVNTLHPAAPLAPALQYVVPSLKSIGNDIKRPGMNEHCYERMPVRAFVELIDLCRDVEQNINLVTQPTIVFTSLEDHLVNPVNSQWITEHIASDDVASLVLENSYHVATLDYDDEVIFNAALKFVQRLESR